MKRRVLVALLAAVIFAGAVFVLNAVPGIDAGRVILICGGNKYEIEGTDSERYYKGKSEKYETEENFEKLLGEVPAFDQSIFVDKEGAVTLKTTMSVSVEGSFIGDVLYTVYDYDGNVLSKAQKKLTLPKEDINGCIVKASVKWGKSKNNYLERVYYFAVIYKK